MQDNSTFRQVTRKEKLLMVTAFVDHVTNTDGITAQQFLAVIRPVHVPRVRVGVCVCV